MPTGEILAPVIVKCMPSCSNIAPSPNGTVFIIHIKAEFPVAFHHSNLLAGRFIKIRQILKFRFSGAVIQRFIGADEIHIFNGAISGGVIPEPGAPPLRINLMSLTPPA